MPELHPGWQSANCNTFFRYRRDDGSEVTMLRDIPLSAKSRPWAARLPGGTPIRSFPDQRTGYGKVRRFGNALTAILALEEVERKRDRAND